MHNGYRERQITQAEYDNLRSKTPSRAIQKSVNKDVSLPMKDLALPSLTMDKICLQTILYRWMKLLEWKVSEN